MDLLKGVRAAEAAAGVIKDGVTQRTAAIKDSTEAVSRLLGKLRMAQRAHSPIGIEEPRVRVKPEKICPPASTRIPDNNAATDTSIGAGVPMSDGMWVAASNPAVLKQPSWERGAVIRGVMAYAEATLADVMNEAGTNRFVNDALVGSLARNVIEPEVSAIVAIMQRAPNTEAGLNLIRKNPQLVKSVAELLSDGIFVNADVAYAHVEAMSKASSKK
jgi:hypothetical protein